GQEQVTVADLLGGKAAAILSAEEVILGIGGGEGGGGCRAESVGAAEDDGADEFLYRASVLPEAGGEMIEELGVGGLGTESAEVVHARDDAAVEEVMPDAIDHDAVEEGIFPAGDPFGQLEAAAGALGYDGRGTVVQHTR